ncbi:transposase, partial [Xanthomonas fragariae]
MAKWGHGKTQTDPIALWKRIEPLIPQVKRSPKGGRPRISDQQALNGIVYV